MKVTIDLSDEAVADIRQAATDSPSYPGNGTFWETDVEVFRKLAAALPVREIRPGDRVQLKECPQNGASLVLERAKDGEPLKHFPEVVSRHGIRLGLWTESVKCLDWAYESSVKLVEGADDDN